MNYNNNQTQVDLSYEQMNNNMLNNNMLNNNMLNNNMLNNNYLNNYGTSDPSTLLQNNLDGGIGKQANLFGNLSNDNLINMANNIDIDPNSLNGTSLDDNVLSKMYSQNNKKDDNKSLIKSLTKEIINNLKENNMSLYDNSSINSRGKKNIDNDECSDDYINELESSHSSNSSNSSNSSKKSKKNKKKKDIIDITDITDIREKIEGFVTGNETPNPIGYIQWFFDDCFNYKDFLILFILYFVLSQEMIKDFFSRYFSSLNPDDEGKIGVQGVIIYGLILTILFMVIKKMF